MFCFCLFQYSWSLFCKVSLWSTVRLFVNRYSPTSFINTKCMWQLILIDRQEKKLKKSVLSSRLQIRYCKFLICMSTLINSVILLICIKSQDYKMGSFIICYNFIKLLENRILKSERVAYCVFIHVDVNSWHLQFKFKSHIVGIK